MVYDTVAIEKVKDFFLANKKTIAVAESVTSGHLQAALSVATDASKFFQGGITTYNLGQKCRHLDIEPTHAIECNCVSVSIAENMAKNVCRLFLSDYGIGVTGYASLVPEININELFIHVSICNRDNIVSSQTVTTVAANSYEAQINYTNAILKHLALSMR